MDLYCETARKSTINVSLYIKGTIPGYNCPACHTFHQVPLSTYTQYIEEKEEEAEFKEHQPHKGGRKSEFGHQRRKKMLRVTRKW